VPCLRPAELAQDDSPAWAAYLHMAEVIEQGGMAVPAFAVLQPTSPLRTAVDVDAAVAVFHERSAQAVMSVTETRHPPSWLRTIDQAGVLRPLLPGDLVNANRQKNPRTFMPNGAVLILDRAFLAATHSYNGERTFAYEMPAERSVDIDTRDDFELAEWLAGRHH
jgi:CMP-N,N'-diacetyllegionaminic acid synthase